VKCWNWISLRVVEFVDVCFAHQFITKFKKLVRNLEISSTARKFDHFFKRYYKIDRGEKAAMEEDARYPFPFLLISSRFFGIRTEAKGWHDERTNVKRRDYSSDLARKGFSAFEAFLLERRTLIHDNQSFLSFCVSPFRSFMPV